jgi:carbon-monoxide dehydrogenase small subunit
VALLRQGIPADERELRHAISGNVCRCTGYQGIVDAIRDAASADDTQDPHHIDRWKASTR